MMIDKITAREKIKYQSYDITLTPLDARCNALRIQAEAGESRFEETISVYDFVDIKKLLRAGKKLKEINEYSLLFLKLMISTGISEKKMEVVRMKDLPYEKVIKDKLDIQAKWGRSKENEDAKGLALKLREDLAIIVPKLLVLPPKMERRNPKKQKQAKIKSLFYDSLKEPL